MQDLDLSIDEGKAQIWMSDVNAELAEIRILLKKVNTANTEVAGSDDTIMQGIYNVGVAMENAWDKMCNLFDEAQDKIVKGVAKIGSTVSSVVDKVEQVRAKFGQ